MPLPENIAYTKRWKTGFWHNWYDGIILLGKESVDREMIVAEDEDEDDNFNWITETEMSRLFGVFYGIASFH